MEGYAAPGPEEGPAQALLRRLAHAAHVLPLNGDDIEILESPNQFFQQLLAGLAAARRRVSIAALYFGTGGGREAEFAAALASAAHDPARPGLRIQLLLDALRCTRPTRGSTAGAAGAAGSAAAATTLAHDGTAGRSSSGSNSADSSTGSTDGESKSSPDGGSAAQGPSSTGGSSGVGGSSSSSPPPMTSTAEMLAVSLLEGQAEGGRVAVSLFHTPALRGLLKRVLPPRVSEVIGVMHMKCYVFDDTVLISGANISSTYLSTRQDRYIVLRNAPQLAAFLNQAVDTVGRFSYQLLPAEQPQAQQADAGQAAERLRRRDALLLALSGSGGGSAALLRGGQPRLAPRPPHHLQRHRLQRGQRYGLGPCPAGVDPVLGAALFSRRLRAELLQLFVPQPAWHSVLDFAALEAEAAEAELEAAAGAPAGPALAAAGDGPPVGQQESGAAGVPPTSAAPAAPPAAAAAAEGAALAGSLGGSAPDTWIVPLVQAGFAGVRQEERCTLALLSWATQQQGQQQGQEGQQQQSFPASWQQAQLWPGGFNWGSWTSSGSSAGQPIASGGSPSVLLQLASPYLNLARPLEWFLTRQAGNAELELITSSPEANGFLGSKGLSGYVPLAYSLLEHRTWRRLNRRRGGGIAATAWLQSRGQSQALGHRWRGRQAALLPWWVRSAGGIGDGGEVGTLLQAPAGAEAAAAAAAGAAAGAEQAAAAGAGAAAAAGAAAEGPPRRVLEYCRPGWEFHAKGLWVSPPLSARQQQAQQAEQSRQSQQAQQPGQEQQQAEQAGQQRGSWAPPAVTAVGSSNFGFRSLHRDLELQFVLVTRNAALQLALGAELAALRRHCQAVQGEAHFLAPGRRGGTLARVAVRLLRGFL
ncbi:hypothetical protein ABPG75_011641 [Micractinium tetrahymenae]